MIRQLIDKKTLKILDLLLLSREKYFHLSELSRLSKIPVSSTFRIINHLASVKIVEVMPIGKMKIYRIASNDETNELEFLLKEKSKKSSQKNEAE